MADILARQRQMIGTTADWLADDLVLGDGEIGFERLSGGGVAIKVGDAVHRYSELPYSLMSTSWGLITGLLPDQTDLDIALAGKVNDTGDTMTGPLSMLQGSTSTVAINFGTANTGIMGVSPTQFNFVTSGATQMGIASHAITTFVPLWPHGGSLTAPAYSFASHTNGGLSSPSSTRVSMSTNGIETMRWNNDKAVDVFGPIRVAEGVAFPAVRVASADPNTLDEYEEGTWTPDVIPTVGAITSFTADGRYTKIGRFVCASATITITDNGTGEGGILCSLPYQCGDMSGHGSGRESQLTYKPLICEVDQFVQSALIVVGDGSYPGGTGTYLRFTISYMAVE